MLDGVLGREYEERFAEEKCLAADRDLLLLHRLEQGGLDLGRRAIDFVRQHEIREQRALLGIELLRALVEHHRADDVGRQQVGRELNAREADAQTLRDRLHGERLGESRHPLEQNVAAGEQPDQQALNHDLLAHDALRDFTRDRLREHGVAGFRCPYRHLSDASAARLTVGSLSRA